MAQHQYHCEECGKHLFDSEKEGGAAGEDGSNGTSAASITCIFPSLAMSATRLRRRE